MITENKDFEVKNNVIKLPVKFVIIFISVRRAGGHMIGSESTLDMLNFLLPISVKLLLSIIIIYIGPGGQNLI